MDEEGRGQVLNQVLCAWSEISLLPIHVHWVRRGRGGGLGGGRKIGGRRGWEPEKNVTSA